MFFYKHYRHKDAGQYVHVDVPLCHTGDLNPHYTQQMHLDGPQHIHVDVQPEVSVRKKYALLTLGFINYCAQMAIYKF